MSPLPRVHASTSSPRAALQERTDAESGSGSTKSIFADVMRAVFDPAPAPHVGIHPVRTRPHAGPAGDPSENETNLSPSISSDAIRQAPSNGNYSTAGTDGLSTGTYKQSSNIATEDQPTGRVSDLSTDKGQSVSSGQSASKSAPATAAPVKSSSDNSRSADASAAGASLKEPQPTGASTPDQTAISVPIAAGEPAPIPLESNGSGSDAKISKPAGTSDIQKNVSMSNPPPSSSLGTYSRSVRDAGNNSGMLQDGLLEAANAIDSKLDINDGKSLLVRGYDSLPWSSECRKQIPTTDSEKYRSPATAVSQSGNGDSAVVPAENGNSGAPSTENGIGSAGDSTNNADHGAAGLTANVSSSNVITANNGNTSSGNTGSITANVNGDSVSPRNQGPSDRLTGIATPSASAGQNTAGAHALPAGSQIEVPHGNVGAPAGLHGGPGPVAASAVRGGAGNPDSLRPLSLASRGTISDTFTALDGETTAEHGVLLHAGPHQVAVGVADPALGWVEVRAERVGGNIAAALTADSAASHAALSSVMPSMATYLQDHHTAVQHLHLETGLTGGQAGAGSQGQSSSQGDTHGSEERAVGSIDGAGGWRNIATPAEQPILPSFKGSAKEGHQVSIRA